MTVQIALLRAVNVAGHGVVAMATLRTFFVELGFDGARTLLQSGNVLCRSADPESAVARLVAETIEASLGLRVGVVVRSAGEIEDVAGRNPFLEATREVGPATLHVAFLGERPKPAAVAALTSGARTWSRK